MLEDMNKITGIYSVTGLTCIIKKDEGQMKGYMGVKFQ